MSKRDETACAEILGGIQCDTVGVILRGKTYVREVFVIDGYDYRPGAEGNWPHEELESVWSDQAVRERFNVPDGYEFYRTGCNDTAEGGYVVYLGPNLVQEDIEVEWSCEGVIGLFVAQKYHWLDGRDYNGLPKNFRLWMIYPLADQ